ncbi:MAG TPA: permease [Synergistales bacterium]|nr:permease [Synergistales bacterium]
MDLRKHYKPVITLTAFALFLSLSFLTDFQPGIRSGKNFFSFIREMMGLLPPAFVLIGLFEVWVKREVIEKHLGEESGIKGHLWAILLAGTVVGGLYVALPLCYILQKKGASLGVIFTYLNAAAICKIPMTLFELSFLGLRFTFVRYLVSLPLLTFMAFLFGKYLGEREYRIRDGS